MTDREQLAARLRAAATPRLDPAVTERHAAAVHRAATAGAASASTMAMPAARWARTHRRLLGGVAAAALALPGVAVAAEGTVPGDVLHPIKAVTSALRAPIDPNLQVRHRIEELERLAARDADEETVAAAIDRARDALSPTTPTDLVDRLDAAVRAATINEDAGTQAPSTPPSAPAPASEPSDGSENADDVSDDDERVESDDEPDEEASPDDDLDQESPDEPHDDGGPSTEPDEDPEEPTESDEPSEEPLESEEDPTEDPEGSSEEPDEPEEPDDDRSEESDPTPTAGRTDD